MDRFQEMGKIVLCHVVELTFSLRVALKKHLFPHYSMLSNFFGSLASRNLSFEPVVQWTLSTDIKLPKIALC